MSQKPKRTSSARSVQVFELTMDNPGDQDELNRRLRKSGEAGLRPPTKIGHTAHGDASEKETGKKKRKGKKGDGHV